MRNSHYHKNMGYYSRHAIFLMDNDIQKLKTIQKLPADYWRGKVGVLSFVTHLGLGFFESRILLLIFVV